MSYPDRKSSKGLHTSCQAATAGFIREGDQAESQSSVTIKVTYKRKNKEDRKDNHKSWQQKQKK